MSSSVAQKSSAKDTTKHTGSEGAGHSGIIKGSNDKHHKGSSDTGMSHKSDKNATKSGNGSGKFTILFSF